jgi:hypothetical protein
MDKHELVSIRIGTTKWSPANQSNNISVCVCVCVYIYIYMHVYIVHDERSILSLLSKMEF